MSGNIFVRNIGAIIVYFEYKCRKVRRKMIIRLVSTKMANFFPPKMGQNRLKLWSKVGFSLPTPWLMKYFTRLWNFVSKKKWVRYAILCLCKKLHTQIWNFLPEGKAFEKLTSSFHFKASVLTLDKCQQMFQLITLIISPFYAKHDFNFGGKKVEAKQKLLWPCRHGLVVSSPLGSYWGRELESSNSLC
jgi:hypothetical protein